MLGDGWELLVEESLLQIASGALHKIALGIVAHHRSTVVILQRGPKCYLPDQYEIPNDLLNPQESIQAGLHRILFDQTNLKIKSMGGFLGCHDYKSAHGVKTRLFVFWVEVLKPSDLKPAPEFSHGVFIFFDEVQRYGIIHPFLAKLVRFWFGANLDLEFLNALAETAKKEGLWRHKVRIAVRRNDGHILLLKRPRKARTFPMLYEMPGGDVDYGENLLEACQRHLARQTQLQLHETLEYLGRFDYRSKVQQESVREFLILAEVTAAASFEISEHAHGLYVDLLKFQKLTATDSCEHHFRAFHRRFFGNLFLNF